MKKVNWNPEKNAKLKAERNISFDVPYIENDTELFLKTIIPSRKMTKKYLRGES